MMNILHYHSPRDLWIWVVSLAKCSPPHLSRKLHTWRANNFIIMKTLASPARLTGWRRPRATETGLGQRRVPVAVREGVPRQGQGGKATWVGVVRIHFYNRILFRKCIPFVKGRRNVKRSADGHLSRVIRKGADEGRNTTGQKGRVSRGMGGQG